MNGIFKNKFCTWLAWLMPVACTGWFSVYVWTAYVFISYMHDLHVRDKHVVPLRERKDIVEMNKRENLTEEEKEFLSQNPKFVKIGEGSYLRDCK